MSIPGRRPKKKAMSFDIGGIEGVETKSGSTRPPPGPRSRDKLRLNQRVSSQHGHFLGFPLSGALELCAGQRLMVLSDAPYMPPGGRRPRLAEQVVLKRVTNQFGVGLEVHFFDHPAFVCADRFAADEEHGGDFVDAQALRQEFENL